MNHKTKVFKYDKSMQDRIAYCNGCNRYFELGDTVIRVYSFITGKDYFYCQVCFNKRNDQV